MTRGRQRTRRRSGRGGAHQAEEAEEAEEAHEAGALGLCRVGAAVHRAQDPVEGEHSHEVHPEHAEVWEHAAKDVAARDDASVGDPPPSPAVPDRHVEVGDDVRKEDQ